MYVIIYLKLVKLQDSRIHLQNIQLLIKTDDTDFEWTNITVEKALIKWFMSFYKSHTCYQLRPLFNILQKKIFRKLNKLRMFFQKQAFHFLCEGKSRPVMKIHEKIILKWGETNLNVPKP